MSNPITRRAFARSGALVCAAAVGRSTDLLAFPASAEQAPWDLSTMMAIAGVPGLQQASVGRAAAKVSPPFLGVADAESGRAMDAASVFEAASLSKPAVAYVTLLMVDRGIVELDAPIRDYLAESPVPDDSRGDRITIRHLLSHGSGLQNWRFRPDDALRLAFAPGEGFSYSGEGYVLVQRVLERRTNTAFARLMRDELFEPLGMRQSSFVWNAALDPHLVRPHSSRGVPQNSSGRRMGRALTDYAAARTPPVAAEAFRHPELMEAAREIAPDRPLPVNIVPNAAASLLTTASDYARFTALLLADASAPPALRLRPATRQAMRTPQSRLAPTLSWGLGIGVEQRDGGSLLWHWGDNGGYKNFVIADPAGPRARVIFTNGSGGLKVIERMLREEYGDLASLLWV